MTTRLRVWLLVHMAYSKADPAANHNLIGSGCRPQDLLIRSPDFLVHLTLLPSNSVALTDATLGLQQLSSQLDGACKEFLEGQHDGFGVDTGAEVLCRAGELGAVSYWEVLDSANSHATRLFEDIQVLASAPYQPCPRQ